MNRIAAGLGEVGLPMPLGELAARRWDAVVVGGGHNGLACAAYLARAGWAVLVLEARARLGGACTLDRPFSDQGYVVSPCAYVVGLLDERVTRELDLERRGLEITLADPQLWAPMPDGTAVTVWLDPQRTRDDLAALGVSRADIDGYFAYERLFDDIRARLRGGARDTWSGDSPTRAELEELLDGEQLMRDVVFSASIAEVLEEFVTDQRLKDALFGSGIIGTFAGPRDPGTAAVRLMHHVGQVQGHPGVWGYVRGGMGTVSFAIADAAQEAGAVLATGVPVAQVLPGAGVRLDDGTLVRAARVVSNADPKRLLDMLPPDTVPPGYRARLEHWDVRSPVVKLNAALTRLPSWAAAPGATSMARGMIDVSHGLDRAQAAFAECAAGQPAVAFGEIYHQTAHDPSVAPPGRHLVSVFAQYAPARPDGTWPDCRAALERQLLELVSSYAPDFTDCLEQHELLATPDIEERTGLTGGHIFQGQVLPTQMWDRRLPTRTEINDVYLCGAATHPGGSVIALNGRNAAMALLKDAGTA